MEEGAVSDHVSHGLRIGSTVVPGTEWIIRDDRAWWNLGDYATRQRAQRPTILCGHWTAGTAGAKTPDDDGPVVYNVMKNRPSRVLPPPAKMQVSIHFVIGADGKCWQTMDPLTTVALHVGMGSLNSRSVGVEVVNPGTALTLRSSERVPRDVITHRMLPTAKLPNGRKVRQLAFYPAQIAAWVRLANLLSDHLPIPRRVPSGADGDLEIDRFTRKEAARWAGAMEHYHVTTSTKLDAGTQLLRALMADGWATSIP